MKRVFWPKMTNRRRPPKDPANPGCPSWRFYFNSMRWRVLILRLLTVAIGRAALDRHLEFIKRVRHRAQSDWRWFILAVHVEAAVAASAAVGDV